MASNSQLNVTYRHTCFTEDIGGSESSTSRQGCFVAEPGWASPFDGFRQLKITSIEQGKVVFDLNGVTHFLSKDNPLTLSLSVDGYEDHDGVVWSTDTYVLKLFIEP